MPADIPSTVRYQKMLGPIIKVLLAGTVTAISPPIGRRPGWTIVLDTGLSVRMKRPDVVRIAERLHVHDFIIAEGTLTPRGAQCEIQATVVLSNREEQLPVIPVIPDYTKPRLGATALPLRSDEQDEPLLPWENTGS